MMRGKEQSQNALFSGLQDRMNALMNIKWWDPFTRLWEVKFALIAKIFATERHTRHRYNGGCQEASIRKRSRKQCRISQDMKCFYFVSSAAGRGLVLRPGLAPSVNFSKHSLFWLKTVVFAVMLFFQENLLNFVKILFLTITTLAFEWTSNIHFYLLTDYVTRHDCIVLAK